MALQAMAVPDSIDLTFLTEGGQTASSIADPLAGLIASANSTLEIALYDVRLPGDVGDRLADALKAAAARGVEVRLLYNVDSYRTIPVPPPPRTRPELIEALPFPTRDVPGEPDLMHHKFVVVDGEKVWMGSANWTLDAWEKQENVIGIVNSGVLAASYVRVFDELWERRRVEGSGNFDGETADLGDVSARAWFCPGRGTALAHRIADALDGAGRIRIASPVITSGPILGTLAEVISGGRADVAGVVDATQIQQVLRQWQADGQAHWKVPLLHQVIAGTEFSGKQSTPYRPDAVHDYMHAKITVADDVAFVGSFNLSRSGEMNAEGVLELRGARIADELAAYIDSIRVGFPDAEAP